MKKSAALLVFISLFGSSYGQQASMSRPVIKTKDNTVHLIVSFSSFSDGKSYRLGVGCEAGDLVGAKLELAEDESNKELPVKTFEQGHNTEQWWGVQKLNARGYKRVHVGR